jgi:hypothetical protein
VIPLSEHLFEQLVVEVLLILKFVEVVQVPEEEVVVVVIIIILHDQVMRKAQKVEAPQ